MKTVIELNNHANGRFFYLASPYSHVDQSVRDFRAAEVNRYAGHLMASGLYVMPTIYMTHENTKSFEFPTDHIWWMGFNKAFIDPSAGMIIAQIPGWDVSKGIVQEINYCRSIGLPVIMISIDIVGNMIIDNYPGK